MVQDRNRVTITINGQNYTVVTTESPEYINRIAKAVDLKMKEVTRSNAGLNPVRKSVLTALSIMDDYEQLKREHQALQKEHEQLLNQIDSQG